MTEDRTWQTDHWAEDGDPLRLKVADLQAQIVRSQYVEARVPVADEADLRVRVFDQGGGGRRVELNVEGRGVSHLVIKAGGGGLPVSFIVGGEGPSSSNEGGEGGMPSDLKAGEGGSPKEVGEGHRPETGDRRQRAESWSATCYECGARASIRGDGRLMTHPYGHEDADPCPSFRYVEGTEQKDDD